MSTARVARRVGMRRIVSRKSTWSPLANVKRTQATLSEARTETGHEVDGHGGILHREGLDWPPHPNGNSDDKKGPHANGRVTPYRPLVLDNLIQSISLPMRGIGTQKIFSYGDNEHIENWQASGLVSAIYVCLQTGNIDRALKIAENRRHNFVIQRRAVTAALEAGTISHQDAEQKYKDLKATNYELFDIRIHNGFLQAFIESMDKVPGQGRWERAVQYYRSLASVWKLAPNDTSFAIMFKGCSKQEAMGLQTAEPHEIVAGKILRDFALTTTQEDFTTKFKQILDDPALSDDTVSAQKVAYTIKRSLAKSTQRDVNLHSGKITLTTIQSILDSYIAGTGTEDTRLPEGPSSAPLERGDEVISGAPLRTSATSARVTSHFNLDLLKGQLSEMMAATTHGLTPIERQRQLESSAYETGRARLKREYELEIARTHKQSEIVLARKSVKSLLWIWHTKFEERLREEMANRSKRKRNGRHYDSIDTPIGVALELMSPEKLSNITISEMIYLTGSDTGLGNIPLGIKTARALLAVGKAVELEHQSEIQAKRTKTARDRRNQLDDKSHALYSSGQIYLSAERDKLRKEYMEQESKDWLPKWSDPDRARVGALLVGMLLDVAKVTQVAKDPETGKDIFQLSPAFHHTYQYIQGKRQGLIKLHPALSEQLAQEPESHIVHPRLLPMLVLPRPWVSWNSGGYHFTKQQVMRTKSAPEQNLYIREASNRNELNIVFNGLDVLGSTAWMVNRDMFDVVLQAWNQGIEIGKLPAKTYDGAIPEKPTNTADQAQRVRYRMALLEHFKKVREIHSLRCDVNYKLEIARAFLGEVMYFPHSMDFRGRVYPIPPNLNHMGNDLSRGLMVFAQAKPLGQSGLRWLKVHLAGKFGFDKANFADREQWTNDHMEQITDSADAPLEGQRWWLTGDDPWQTLAACKELVKALRSPDPLKFKSQLPIHQDGSCNGLQHYAALGGDIAGAQQVNLIPGDRPADVYTGVADLVRADIIRDAQAGIEIAKVLQDKITRKVVKQTIMTTVYGVTFVGAKEQIHSQLKDRGDVPFDRLHEAGVYLTKKVLRSIGSEFRGASAIQVWLSETARLIAKSVAPDRIKLLENGQQSPAITLQGQRRREKKRAGTSFMHEVREEQMTAVIWTSPVGLTCVQPYRREAKTQIMTSLQTIFIRDPNIAMPVDPQKQASAFPPNFIHSLDASHMFLTAIECKARDLDFASVHDSYWTHACDIDLMSELIRDTFAKLHSAPILADLRKEFVQRYKGHKVAVLSISQRMNGGPQIASRMSSLHTVSEARLDELQGVEMSPEEVRVATEKALKEAKKKKTALQSAESNFQDVDNADDVMDLDTIDSAESDSPEEDVDSIGSEDDHEDFLKNRKTAQVLKIHDRAFKQARGKWVDLIDIIPDLPQRGAFDVEVIKNSLYFFS